MIHRSGEIVILAYFGLYKVWDVNWPMQNKTNCCVYKNEGPKPIPIAVRLILLKKCEAASPFESNN
jgi:hypothetical protein